MKFTVVNRNHSLGRLWEEGEVVEFDQAPNHHFAPTHDDAKVTVEFNKVVIDPMAPRGQSRGGATALSQVLTTTPNPQGGFTSGLKDTSPMTVKTQKKIQ